MTYRNDLEAAELRIRDLEQELAHSQQQLRSHREDVSSRMPWGWLIGGGIATLVLVGAGAGQVLYARNGSSAREIARLEAQLGDARADVAVAEVERERAYEALAHRFDRKRQAHEPGHPMADDPMVQLANSPVESSGYRAMDSATSNITIGAPPGSTVVIDGRPVDTPMPGTVSVEPGSHQVQVTTKNGVARNYSVRTLRGYAYKLAVD